MHCGFTVDEAIGAYNDNDDFNLYMVSYYVVYYLDISWSYGSMKTGKIYVLTQRNHLLAFCDRIPHFDSALVYKCQNVDVIVIVFKF